MPAPEWRPYGSHFFVLPLLELMEAEDCLILAANVAWDGSGAATSLAAPAPGGRAPEPAAFHGDDGGSGSGGCARLHEAAARAAAALRAMRAPASEAAYGLSIARSEAQHTPSFEEWRARMEALLGQLQVGRLLRGRVFLLQ